MTGGEWAALIASGAGLVTAVGTAFGVLINLLVSTSRDAMSEMRKDRDYWRDRAERCELRRLNGGTQ